MCDFKARSPPGNLWPYTNFSDLLLDTQQITTPDKIGETEKFANDQKFEIKHAEKAIKNEEIELLYKTELEREPSKVPITTEDLKTESLHESIESHLNGMFDVAINSQSQRPETPVIWKCPCGFECDSQHGLRNHIASLHRDPLFPNKFKCALCDFSAMHLHNLKKHGAQHKPSRKLQNSVSSEHTNESIKQSSIEGNSGLENLIENQVAWKCVCSFECNSQNELRMHIISVHKDPSSPNIFKCAFCDFNTKYIHRLKHHTMKHNPLDIHWLKSSANSRIAEMKSSSKVRMYRCEFCGVTKRKRALKSHLLSQHGDSPEALQCNWCEYKAKCREALSIHKLRHRDLAGMIMYKCGSCPYESVRKGCLASHVKKQHKK